MKIIPLSLTLHASNLKADGISRVLSILPLKVYYSLDIPVLKYKVLNKRMNLDIYISPMRSVKG